MSDIFIGRQPIYDRQKNITAYELLFRDSRANRAEHLDGDQATCQVLSNALVEIGLTNLCGNRPAFIKFTRAFLDGQLPIPFERDRIIIELLLNTSVDDGLLKKLDELKSIGFQIALDDFVLSPKTRPLLDAASIVKLDIQALSKSALSEHIAELKRFPVQILAEKIETLDEFNHCRSAGFDMFQGYFLSRPNLIQGRELPKNKVVVVLLLSRIQDPDVSFRELEDLIRQDVALTLRLLQLVNSSMSGVPTRVDSIQSALRLLGLARVRNLVTLLTLSGMSDTPSALLETALIRAKMCEQLGAALNGNGDAYFTVGLLSVLELFLQCPLAEILKSLPVSAEITAALRNFEGNMGVALKCVLCFELGNGDSTQCLHLEKPVLQAAYLSAIRWAARSLGELGNREASTTATAATAPPVQQKMRSGSPAFR